MPASFLKSLKKLEGSLGYEFKNTALLIEAVTHSSYSNEHPDKAPTYNERLEFLGDAVLGLAVVEELFRVEERLSESDMAKLKSFLVSRPVLSEAARRLNLGMVLRLGKGEEASGGRGKDNILADALEAVVGAVFIDSEYYVAKEVILRILGERIEQTVRTRKSHDYKTELQELTQEVYGSLPEYRVVKEEGEEHNKTFSVEVLISGHCMGGGKGRSKKEAQMAAAREALERLRVDG